MNELKKFFFLIFSLPSPRSPSSCASEMERWVEDIRMAIDLAEQSNSPQADLLSASLSENSKPRPLREGLSPPMCTFYCPFVVFTWYVGPANSCLPLLSVFFSILNKSHDIQQPKTLTKGPFFSFCHEIALITLCCSALWASISIWWWHPMRDPMSLLLFFSVHYQFDVFI